jgi:hypothetical protein
VRSAAFFFGFNLVAGTLQNGTWEGNVFFPRFSEDGTWKIDLLQLKDATGNTLFLDTAALQATGFPTDLVVIQPSLTGDGTISNPAAGGTVTDDTFGSRAQVTFPGGVLADPTDVAIDVFLDPLDIPAPAGYQGPGTLFVNLELTPTPVFPLPAPGLMVVLPLDNPLPPGTSLDLFRVEPSTGNLVPALNVAGTPVLGTVNAPDGLSATFPGIARLSTVVGLLPQTPQDQIENIISAVEALVASGKLKSSHGRLLKGTLEAAIRHLDQGRTRFAILLLKGFVVEVKLLVRLKRLATADGQPLIDAAEGVIAKLKP